MRNHQDRKPLQAGEQFRRDRTLWDGHSKDRPLIDRPSRPYDHIPERQEPAYVPLYIEAPQPPPPGYERARQEREEEAPQRGVLIIDFS